MSPKKFEPEPEREFTPEQARLDSLMILNAGIIRATSRLTIFNNSMEVKSIAVEIKALIAQSDALIHEGLNQPKLKEK